ncbi:hypothetical protein CDAR_170661 [Caerostris darwini]|uniref:Uncharacterized protein n=1 Tax=Caerostris darwini TaxID=1538125 RepID=A0AAV4W9B1_9ARAC|nr:hypothetical protein CDAR_170661 [Caerostris darwini]
MALEMDEQKMFFVLRCSPMKYGEEAEDIIFKQNGEVQAMGRTYHFDNVFPSSASNEEIYRTVIAEKMQLILEGRKCLSNRLWRSEYLEISHNWYEPHQIRWFRIRRFGANTKNNP